jgi:hypothetical protein
VDDGRLPCSPGCGIQYREDRDAELSIVCLCAIVGCCIAGEWDHLCDTCHIGACDRSCCCSWHASHNECCGFAWCSRGDSNDEEESWASGDCYLWIPCSGFLRATSGMVLWRMAGRLHVPQATCFSVLSRCPNRMRSVVWPWEHWNSLIGIEASGALLPVDRRQNQ